MPVATSTELPDAELETFSDNVGPSVTLSWPDVIDNGNYRLQLKQVTKSQWGIEEVYDESTAETTVSNLVTGVLYEARIRTETEHKTGEWAYFETFDTRTLVDLVLESAPPTGAIFERNTEVSKLVRTLALVYYSFNEDVQQVKEDRYVETATGFELDRRAEPLGTERPTGEDDSKFRKRAIAARTRSTSTTTFEDFAEATLEVLDADEDDVRLEVDYVDAEGAVIVNVNSSVLEESPFTESEIINLLEGAIPMSRRVVLRTTDGFQFSSPSTTSSKSGKGFGEGQWTT